MSDMILSDQVREPPQENRPGMVGFRSEPQGDNVFLRPSFENVTHPKIHKILIIDDDPMMRAAVKFTLKQNQYVCFEADNTTDGMQLVRTISPDLILCDLYMPGVDGFGFLDSLRNDPRTAAIPFILTTGDKDKSVQRRSMGKGADDFLAKPFSSVDLIAAVNGRIQRYAIVKSRVEQTNERLIKMLEASRELVAIVDAGTMEITYLNEAGHRLTGLTLHLSKEPLMLKGIYDLGCRDSVMNQAIPKALDQGHYCGDAEIIGVNGNKILVNQTVIAHKNCDGSIDFISITAQEIGELRQAEDRLRRLSRAVDQSPVSIVITDPSGHIEYVNPKFTQVTGYTMQEALGKNPRILKSGEMSSDGYDRLWKTISNGGEWRGELHNKKKNGELYWEQVSISAIVDEKGCITHYLAVKEDITERKKAENERNALQMQLHQSQKLESIGRLAAGIAHEINTPTQYIGDNVHFFNKAFEDLDRLLVGHAGLVAWLKKQGPLTEEAAQILRPTERVRIDFLRREIPKSIADALEGISRVAKIVRAMKDFSHPGGEEKHPVDLNRAIESTLTISRNEWKYVAELQMNLDPSLPPVPCLPGEFNQVILNLVVNAAHAIADVVNRGEKEKGCITVTTEALNDWVEIRISDTGTGIPEHVRSRIFEPFFTTKEVGKGTGQGLALARSVIVERHGGTIHFETQMGKGTAFIIRLPLKTIEPVGKSQHVK